MIAYLVRAFGRDVIDARSVIIATAQDSETAALIVKLLNEATLHGNSIEAKPMTLPDNACSS